MLVKEYKATTQTKIVARPIFPRMLEPVWIYLASS
jgi:hypothetical protein